MPNTRILHAAAAALLLATTACWPVRDGLRPWDRRPSEALELEVRNQNFHDVVVYVMPDGHWQRIGMVTGLRTDTLDVPPHLAGRPGGFRILVSPIGSRQAYMSDPVYAGPGDVVVLTVMASLGMSYWHIRP